MYQFKASLNPRKIVILLLTIVGIVFISARLFPGPFSRFNSLSTVSLQTIDKTSSESTSVRILIWKESLSIIKNNFVFGTGVGDANDALREAYKQNGLTGAYEHKFNAHNQFFQTFIGLGVIGFGLLLAMTLGLILKAFRNKNFLLFIFSLVITLNFMVESMLQTSAGVLFFVFFCCFFGLVDEKQLRDETPYVVGEETRSS